MTLIRSQNRQAAREKLGALSTPKRRFLARTAPRRGSHAEETLCLLSVMMGDANCDVRAEAYRSLTCCPELHDGALLLELEKHLEQEPWVQVERARLLSALASTDVRRVLTLLRPLAASGVFWVEQELAQCLAICWKLDRTITLDALADWLKHRSAAVRAMGVRFYATGRWPEGSTVPAVLARVVEDPSNGVRVVCARGMSLWAKDDLDLAIPALRVLSMDRSHWITRATVARGLTHWRKYAPYEALGILLPMLRDVMSPVRRLALRQLRVLQHEFPTLTVEALSGDMRKAEPAQYVPNAIISNDEGANEGRRSRPKIRQIRK